MKPHQAPATHRAYPGGQQSKQDREGRDMEQMTAHHTYETPVHTPEKEKPLVFETGTHTADPNEMPAFSGPREKRAAPQYARLIDLPVIRDLRGSLTYIEGFHHIPFEIKRVYYLYDVPGGASRGGHAHKQLEQLLIAISGSFDVILDDGQTRQIFPLNRSYLGLHIPRMVWRELDNFSSGSVCLVLASDVYEEDDYYRNYDEFITEATRTTKPGDACPTRGST